MQKKRGAPPTSLDQIETTLVGLKAELPCPRLFTSRSDLVKLIQAAGGPRTAKSIRDHAKITPIRRIAHVFSSIDTQVVVDVLANDLDSVIAELIKGAISLPPTG